MTRSFPFPLALQAVDELACFYRAKDEKVREGGEEEEKEALIQSE